MIPAPSAPGSVLILACGNPLRSDDGLAWHAAEELRRSLASSAVEIVSVHQLTPDLAADVQRAGLVIFLDASREFQPGEVACRPLTALNQPSRFSHHADPSQILSLSAELYGKTPPAFLVAAGGLCFDHGDRLSAVARQTLPRIVALVQTLLANSPAVSIASSRAPQERGPGASRHTKW